MQNVSLNFGTLYRISYWCRVDLHIVWWKSYISRPTRKMRSTKSQDMNDTMSNCAMQEKLLFSPEGAMLTISLSLRITHCPTVKLSSTITWVTPKTSCTTLWALFNSYHMTLLKRYTLLHQQLCVILLVLLQDFISKLKDHLSHLFGKEFNGNESLYINKDRQTVWIIGDHIYPAKVLQVNYTIYDIHCDQDSMNPWTHCNVMVVSQETGPNAYPYWYACILGVFHAQVMHMGPEAQSHSIQHMEFL